MRRMTVFAGAPCVAAILLLAGCKAKTTVDESAEAPPAPKVETVSDLNLVKVDRPERFKLVSAGEHQELPELNATGVVNPNIEKSVPVNSLAGGRVIEVHAKLGDDVKKGQLLLKVQSNDITTAFVNLNQARADEGLARKQLERARLLYQHGAISLNDLQIAENAEDKAKAALDAAAQALRTLGADVDHPSPILNVYAPISGTVVEQNIVLSSRLQSSDSQPSLFTVADLSNVWVVCDVYENDLPAIRVGDAADVRLDAYPDRTFRGRVSNIGKILDTNIRTTKVRIVLNNPGVMRAGMFVRAVFYGQRGRTYATVPTGAVLHLHDRDWVFLSVGSGQFRRTEITGGKTDAGLQEVTAGLSPGQQVVKDALALESESEQ